MRVLDLRDLDLLLEEDKLRGKIAKYAVPFLRVMHTDTSQKLLRW